MSAEPADNNNNNNKNQCQTNKLGSGRRTGCWFRPLKWPPIRNLLTVGECVGATSRQLGSAATQIGGGIRRLHTLDTWPLRKPLLRPERERLFAIWSISVS